MQSICTRRHRNSILEPATIHDIPFEVLRESFLLLIKQVGSDLASPSLVCRAFRAVALDVMNSRKEFIDDDGRLERVICGLHLRSLVGLESCTIKYLVLGLKSVGKEYIHLIARVVAPTLTSLWFECDEIDSGECYEALDVFFVHSVGIRNLRLECFDFGDDPSSISQMTKEVFSRLNQFDLLDCRGNIRMFVENTPIPNLQSLNYESRRDAGEEEEIISEIASSYRTLISIDIVAKFESSAGILKIVECCPNLERLKFADLGAELILERSDILAIASLPLLKCLKLYGCKMSDDAFSAFSRLKRIKELRLYRLVDPSVLSSIGRNLVNLELRKPSNEVIDGIVENFPNLQYLGLEAVDLDEEEKEELVGSLKSGLKKLAKLKVNEESIRLGTDWEGYKIEEVE